MSLSTITIGANDYTAYASVAEADAYLAVDPVRGTRWGTLSAEEKGQNLIAATRLLDLLPYSGTKVSATQENEWPRTGATCDGTPVTSTDVPNELERATILQAGTIAITPAQSQPTNGGSNIKKVQAGPASVEFFRAVDGNATIADRTVAAVVQCLLRSGSSLGFGIAPGAGKSSSSFCDPNAPDLDDGFA